MVCLRNGLGATNSKCEGTWEMTLGLEGACCSASGLYGTYFLLFQMYLPHKIRIFDSILLHDFINNCRGLNSLGVKVSVVHLLEELRKITNFSGN
jgi:hypothetical protein